MSGFSQTIKPGLARLTAKLKSSTWLNTIVGWLTLPGAPEALDGASGESLEFLNPRRIVKAGSVGALAFFFVMLGWSALAPLDSATMSSGVVVVESRRKTIQHLEGGIVKDVLVAEGDQVKTDQLLVRMDDTQARATLNLLQGQADALDAQEARLKAERDGLPEIIFPAGLMSRQDDPKVAEAIKGEKGAFAYRHETLVKQVALLQGRMEENSKSIAGLKAEQTALETQIFLIKKESTMIETLVSKGMEAMPRLLALQRQDADLSGQRGTTIEKMAQVDVNTGETQLQIVNLRNQFLSDVSKDLRDAQTRRFDLQDKIQSASDVLNRQEIKAPVEGRVVSLNIHTVGAVIRPGDTVMEIVPEHDELDVEAHLRPEDVDDVAIGATAKVSLTSYKQRRLPTVTGTVSGISADRLTDQRTGQPYFTAQIKVNRDAWKDYPEVHLVPGMPVEVAVETGSRTAIEYFFEPIRAVMRRGMREK